MPVIFTAPEIAALVWFLLAWIGYSFTLEHGRFARHSLNARMDIFRREWMLRMIEREVRIIDSQILGSLQNGSAFFASASLIALGGVVSLFKSSDEALTLLSALPFAMPSNHAMWDLKVFGLVVIFAYGFFKFAWAYRILNYAAILIGATPNVIGAVPPKAISDPSGSESRVNLDVETRLSRSDQADQIGKRSDAQGMAGRAAAMITLGGRHFNRGQRAFFFALGYLGWFISPYVFMISTAAIVAVMARRQFGAESLRPLKESSDDGSGSA